MGRTGAGRAVVLPEGPRDSQEARRSNPVNGHACWKFAACVSCEKTEKYNLLPSHAHQCTLLFCLYHMPEVTRDNEDEMTSTPSVCAHAHTQESLREHFT